MNHFRNVIRCWIIFLLLLSINSFGQNNMFSGFEKKRDDAVAALKNFPQSDTARVNALLRVANTAIFLKQQKQVEPYLQEALHLSHQLNYTKGLADCYLFLGNMSKGSSNLPLAHTYFDSVIQIPRSLKDTLLVEKIALARRQKGMIYYEQENYYTALNQFFDALTFYEVKPNKQTLFIYTIVSIIYIRLNNLAQAEFYAQKNVTLVQKGFDKMLQAQSYLSLVDILIQRRELSKASYYLDKIQPYMPDSVEVLIDFGYYQKRGQIAFLQQQYDSSYNYYQQAARFADGSAHSLNKSSALYYLSTTALKLGKMAEAKKYADDNLIVAEKLHAKGGMINALVNLSDYYHQAGDQAKAYDYLQRATILKDSLLSETNVKQANTLAAIYESEKKQNEIFHLQNEQKLQAASVKQKSILNYVFVAIILLLLLIGYMIYRNARNRQKIANQRQEIQQQKIIELEKDRQLLGINAMLKGQEEERSRIAKDLHDGLGGMLSGVKMSFINMKENLVNSSEHLHHFDHSANLLDNTITELRKIAHNLMPEALVRFGINDALKDFCDSITSLSSIKVVYQCFGEERNLGAQADLTVYRIIQELVNNALKHADATRIIVQLTRHPDKVGITVEDDGRGFDTRVLETNKGAGFVNLENRVHYFKGSIDIYSKPGEGTSVNIELKA